MRIRRPGRLAAAGLCALLLVATSGCIARTVREDVFKEGDTEVFLRATKKGSKLVDRGYDHPISIAPVRIAHMLSRMDLRLPESNAFFKLQKDKKDRVPAFELELLYVIADGVSQALAKAKPSQEVVVMSVHQAKSFLIFDRDFLTNFVAYVKGDQLYVHMNRYSWEIPPRREDRLPEPHVGEHPMDFKLIPSEGMALVDEQSGAFDWRNPIFKRPTRTRITPGGKVVRKTILMEMDDEQAPAAAGSALPANLSPEALRDLADLEEIRRKGDISESEYNRRKRAILLREAPEDDPTE